MWLQQFLGFAKGLFVDICLVGRRMFDYFQACDDFADGHSYVRVDCQSGPGIHNAIAKSQGVMSSVLCLQHVCSIPIFCDSYNRQHLLNLV